MSYGFLAGSYDGLTQDVGYEKLAKALEKNFAKAKCPVKTVLDLACGTGSLTWLLAEKGYEMIGVDASSEMLSQAMEKRPADFSEIEPMFLNQNMEELDLYGTIDACICCLDSVNYVTRPALLQRAFRRVHTFLMPGGLFLFDARTPELLKSMDGQVFLDENEDTYCVWRGEFSAKRNICTYFMDIFRLDEEADAWIRGEEVHEEYAYSPETLADMLRQAGFAWVKTWGSWGGRGAKPGDDRVYFAARKGV